MSGNPSKREYVVLIERRVDTDVGDVGFVFLGTYEGHRPRDARRSARGYWKLDPTTELITVPASAWKANR